MKKLMQRSVYALAALVTVFAVGFINVRAQNAPQATVSVYRLSDLSTR